MILRLPGFIKKNKHNLGSQRLITLETALVFLVVVLMAAIRIRLLSVPLERDEGEFAYMGQLMLNGIPPYKLAYNMKMPGIYAIYALIMAVFGQSIEGIHLGLLFANSVSIVLVFLIARRLFGKAAGIAACLSYAILSISPSFLAIAAHATHFVVLFALAGVYIIIRNDKHLSACAVYIGGVMMGLSFLMKQPGAFFGVFTLFYILYCKRRAGSRAGLAAKKAGLHVVGIITPIAIAMLLLWRAGVWNKFWFWTFEYGACYASAVKLSEVVEVFTQQMESAGVGVWPLFVVSIFGFFKLLINTEARRWSVFTVSFLIASILAVCPGFYFRGHYFILMLPAVSILCGMAFSLIEDALRAKKVLRFALVLPALLFMGAAVFPFAVFKEIFFMAPPADVSRIIYQGCPFVESVTVAEYIKSNTSKDDCIAVLGSEPQIYFYSQRRSAMGYIYMYPLMETQPFAHKMQEEMIREIKSNEPAYIILIFTPVSWNRVITSDSMIFTQMEKYLKQSYYSVGVVPIECKQLPDYFEDPGLEISVFKRK